MRTYMSYLVPFAITLAACDSSSSPGEGERDGGQRDADASHDMDAASHDASTSGDAAPSDDASTACDNEVGSCPAASSVKWSVLVDAADFGSGSRLVATGGQSVVVALEDGSYQVLRLRDPEDSEGAGPAYVAWPLSTGELVPIAVRDGRPYHEPPLKNGLFVIACDDASTHCSMFQTELENGELGTWQEDALPEDFVAEGVVFDDVDGAHSPCVFGGGLLCWTGEEWAQAIALSGDLRLRDVSIGGPWSLAAGDHGRWFKRERGEADVRGTWEEQSPLGDLALTQVSVSERGGVIVGDGRIVASIGAEQDVYACGVPKEIAVLLLDRQVHGLSYAVTPAGEVLQHSMAPSRPKPYCSYDMRALGDILDTTYAPCGGSDNPRVLTEKVLWGANVCILFAGE